MTHRHKPRAAERAVINAALLIARIIRRAVEIVALLIALPYLLAWHEFATPRECRHAAALWRGLVDLPRMSSRLVAAAWVLVGSREGVVARRDRAPAAALLIDGDGVPVARVA